MTVELREELTSGDARGTVRMTAAQALIRYLQVQYSERDGIQRRLIPALFAIFGHGNVLGIGQALEEVGADLPYYQAKNEQSMVHTAIGYAKASDRLSTLACTASVGPGSTNMLTGAATATVNRIPVLLLPADTFAGRLQGPVMQALEHRTQLDWTVNDAFRPVSVFFDRITRPEQLISTLPQAMRTLLDPADTGAVTIALPQDVEGEPYDFPAAMFVPRIWRVSRRPVASDELDDAIAIIRASRRPLIIAGGGVHYSDATAELQRFADAHGIPVAETPAGKGSYRNGPLTVGAVGRTGTRAANALAKEADLVICVGTRLIDGVTGSHTLFQDPGVRFVGINVASSDAHKLGAVTVVADARLALADLSTALGEWSAPTVWAEQADQARARWQSELTADLEPRAGEKMTQGQVLARLNSSTTPEDVLVVASGSPHSDITKLWNPGEAARVYLEVGYSCMAHEIPAALGFRLANPDLDGDVFVVIGDGTYLMGASELATAVQERLKIIVLVVNNHGFQSIHGLQRRKTGSSFGLEFRMRNEAGLSGPYVPIDYAANAASFGCVSYQVSTTAELDLALADARTQNGPCVIVAEVEPRRTMLDSQCWWDVGVAQVSASHVMQEIAGEHVKGRHDQRFYG
jgi:3D-(3,5/4)-trihydroxycyclohexane-1,2-dione acylhydrolase (decyclizing)